MIQTPRPVVHREVRKMTGYRDSGLSSPQGRSQKSEVSCQGALKGHESQAEDFEQRMMCVCVCGWLISILERSGRVVGGGAGQ